MKHHKSLSLDLFNVLEDLGATIETRKLTMEGAISFEVMGTTAVAPHSLYMYIFGSRYEGTYTEGFYQTLI